MSTLLNLAVILSLKDGLSAGLKGISDRLAKVTAGGAALAAAGTQMLAAMRGPIAAFAEAEDAASRLKVALMGSSGQVAREFGAINAMALEMGNRLPGTTAEFQDLMTVLVRQGLTAETILGGTADAAGQLAVILEMGKPAAGEFMAQLQDATATTARDMVALADAIQRTFHVGVDPGNMLAAFSALAPGMAAIKQQGLTGARAMAPLIAMLDQAKLSGSAAGNALTKIFAGAFGADNVKDANASPALAKAKIRLEFTRDGEFLGLDNLFAQLAKLRELNTESRLELIKGLWGDDSETKQALDTLIKQGQTGYDAMLAKITAQADLQARVNERLSTLTNLWDAASGTFRGTLAALGATIEPELKALTKWFNEASVSLQELIAAHPQLAKITAEIGLFGGAAAVALGSLGLALGALSGFLGLGKKGRGAAGGAGGGGLGGTGVVPVWVTNKVYTPLDLPGSGGGGGGPGRGGGGGRGGPGAGMQVMVALEGATIGYAVGTAIYDKWIAGTSLGDSIGAAVAKVMAGVFGSQQARDALGQQPAAAPTRSTRPGWRGWLERWDWDQAAARSGAGGTLALGPEVQTLTAATEAAKAQSTAASEAAKAESVAASAAAQAEAARSSSQAEAAATQAEAAAAKAAAAALTGINGTIRIQVTGPAQVTGVSKSGPLDIEAEAAYTGKSMGGF